MPSLIIKVLLVHKKMSFKGFDHIRACRPIWSKYSENCFVVLFVFSCFSCFLFFVFFFCFFFVVCVFFFFFFFLGGGGRGVIFSSPEPKAHR